MEDRLNHTTLKQAHITALWGYAVKRTNLRVVDEAMAPQTLVYGWALQFGVAIVPWFLAKMLHPSASAHLGGTWTSLALLNLGSAALWIGIFQEATRNLWSGFAYLLWAIALFPVMRQVLAIVRADPTLEPDDAVMEMSGQPGTDWRS